MNFFYSKGMRKEKAHFIKEITEAKNALLSLPEDTQGSNTGHTGRELCPLDGCGTLGLLYHLHYFLLLVTHLKTGGKEICTKKFITALVIITN